MANNASATVDLRILISVVQNQSQNIRTIQQQLQTMLQQFQASVPTGAMGALTNQVGGLNTQVRTLSQTVPPGVSALNSLNATVNTLTRSFRLLTGGFLAFQSVQFFKHLADTAARAQVLQTVLHVVAANAGVTAQEIDKVDKQVQRLGITAAASRESLTKLLQGRLAPELGAKLARAAQDLAVISDKDSSQTFSRLITNIQQLDTVGLRWMGIIVSREEAERKYKIAIAATGRELTQREKVQGFANEVLFKAAQLEGTYESAMGNVAKQVASLTRLMTQYREVLGASLVPAYSAIVVKITEMFEKLIVLGRQFSANREQAKSLAEVLGLLTSFFTETATFLMQHLDVLVKVAAVYAGLRLTLMLFNGMERYFLWLTRVVDWFIKLRIVLTALSTGQIGFALAVRALGASSNVAATEMIRLSTAQTGVGLTANQASLGVQNLGRAITGVALGARALMLTWGLMAASIAAPIVGFAILNLRQQAQEQTEKSTLQRGLEARTPPKKDSFEGQVAMIGRSFGVLPAIETEQKVFEDWLKEHPALAAGKTKKELLARYNREIDDYSKGLDIKAIAAELGAAQAKRETAMAELTRLREPAPPGILFTDAQIKAAEANVKAAQKDVEDLTRKSDYTFKFVARDASTRRQLEGLGRISALKDKLALEMVSEGRTTLSVKTIKAELDAETRLQREREKNHQADLDRSDEALDEQTKFEERMAVVRKKQLVGISDFSLEYQAAIKGLGLEKFAFTGEGVLTSQYSAQLENYRTLLKQAEDLVKEKGTVDIEVQKALIKGLEPLGSGAAEPLDLLGFRGVQPRIQALAGKVPGLAAAAATQLDRARIGVRDEALKPSAEVVNEAKRVAKLVTDERVQAAETELEVERAKQENLSILREAGYKDGLIGLTEYHDGRRARIEEEGAIELKSAQTQIAGALAQQAIRGQSDEANRRNAIAVEDALNKEFKVRSNINRELLQENRLQEERRVALRDKVQQGIVSIGATTRGTEGALGELEFRLAAMAKEFAPVILQGLVPGASLVQQQAAAQAIGLLNLTKLTEEAKIFRTEREKAYQAEKDIGQALNDQLELAKQRREVQAAQDQRAVAEGRLTDAQAQVRQNRRAEIERLALRPQIDIAERDVARAQEQLDRETKIKTEELAKLPLTKDERDRQLVEHQKKYNDELTNTKRIVGELALAYEEWGARIVTYNQQLRTSFIGGFADAMTQTIVDFKHAGDAWKNMAQAFSTELVGIFTRAFAQNIFRNLSFAWVDQLFNRVDKNKVVQFFGSVGLLTRAEGGLISGPGTGTSDSIPAMLSAGEHVMPAAKTATWLPVLEAIRTGRLSMMGGGGLVQAVALGSIIPRRYAGGGVVMTDAGAAAVTPGGMGGNMMVSLHPEALNMTMRDWLEHEVVRQHSRR